MPILDDVCIQLHAVSDGVDKKFAETLNTAISSNTHFSYTKQSFTINHYAGQVTYDIDGFSESNKDTLFRGIPDIESNFHYY
jgi:myosin-1